MNDVVWWAVDNLKIEAHRTPRFKYYIRNLRISFTKKNYQLKN